MILGAHTLVYADDAEAARAFFRDVLELPGVDSGNGWLIFELPPGGLGCHPSPGSGREVGQHELSLMCRDVHGTVAELERRGVDFVTPIEDEGWGLMTYFKIPGAGLMGLYEPRHASPLSEFAAG